ncbi:MAG: hypothetical protein ACR2PS_06045 [Pseudomonadales bacterium]
MRKLILMLLVITGATHALGAELVSEISWREAKEQQRILTGEVADSGELSIRANPAAQFLPIIVLENPAIELPVYALKGMIRYSGVTGDGYLQLDNYFDGGGVFFSKSLAPNGPLQKISGDSDWRPFILPFFANTGRQAHDGNQKSIRVPDKISLAVFLPTSGTVSLKDVALYQYAAGENPLLGMGYGANSRSLGLLGAIGGSLLGIWGAVIGVLSNLGRGRGFVLGSINLFGFVGALGLFGGLAALAKGQPGQVYFPLFLVGALLLMALALKKNIRTHYEALELRKMTSLDTGI